jgi:hypothetical protein
MDCERQRPDAVFDCRKCAHQVNCRVFQEGQRQRKSRCQKDRWGENRSKEAGNGSEEIQGANQKDAGKHRSGKEYRGEKRTCRESCEYGGVVVGFLTLNRVLAHCGNPFVGLPQCRPGNSAA